MAITITAVDKFPTDGNAREQFTLSPSEVHVLEAASDA